MKHLWEGIKFFCRKWNIS